MVIRDEGGNVVATAIKQAIFSEDIALIEVATVKLDIHVAIDASLTPLIIEMDCKDVVDLMLQKKSSKTGICGIIIDIQSEMQKGENLFKFSIFQEIVMYWLML